MGIWEQMSDEWLDALDARTGISSPREHGVDVVDGIRAMRDGKVRVFMGMGGNFVRATPDTPATEAALRSLDLTVQVSTKLNGSHAVTGKQALILPTLGRTEVDRTGGIEQFVTVEDSMSMVHASYGRAQPVSPYLRSETDIVCSLALACFPGSPVDWAAMRNNYSVVREHIAAVVPGCADYEAQATQRDGFVLPNTVRDDRAFPTQTGKARLTVNEQTSVAVPPGHLLLQTMRSHDQYNTTIYGLNDRYRGVHDGRRVVFVHPQDLRALALSDGQMVDLVSIADDGERRAEAFRVVRYDRTAPGCAAAYFPETNVLVPLDSVADVSNTPTSKSLVVRLEPTGSRRSASGR